MKECKFSRLALYLFETERRKKGNRAKGVVEGKSKRGENSILEQYFRYHFTAFLFPSASPFFTVSIWKVKLLKHENCDFFLSFSHTINLEGQQTMVTVMREIIFIQWGSRLQSEAVEVGEGNSITMDSPTHPVCTMCGNWVTFRVSVSDITLLRSKKKKKWNGMELKGGKSKTGHYSCFYTIKNYDCSQAHEEQFHLQWQ